MPAKIPDTATQQIAVILSTSGSGQPLLKILRQLIGKVPDTELHGVFIEDDELQRVAALPFVKELCRLTLSVREIHETRIDRSVALRMRTARNEVEGLARHMGISHTFRTARGSTVRLLRETVHSAKITIIEPRRKFAAPATGQARYARRAVRRIVVVIDDTVTGDEALLTAALLAEGQTHRISILLRAQSPAELEAMDHMIHGMLPAGQKRLLQLPDQGVQSLITAVQAERADMLVIAASEDMLKPKSLALLLRLLECPICLVKPSDSTPEEPSA